MKDTKSSHPINQLQSQASDKNFDVTSSQKEDWIFLHGSDLLQQSIVLGYDADDRYLDERLQNEYPGFVPIDPVDLIKTDSPSAACLKTCLYFDNAYCSHSAINTKQHYITIDKYLGEYTIIKKIENKSLTNKLRKKLTSGQVVKAYVAGLIGLCIIYGSILFSWNTLLLILGKLLRSVV